VTSLVIVNEASIFRLLWLKMLRRSVHVVTADPWLPFLAGALTRLAGLIEGLGAGTRDPDLTAFFADFHAISVHWAESDIFAQTEQWVERRHRFAELDAEGFAYALPFKDVTVNRMRQLFGLYHFLNEAAERFSRRAFVVYGADPETIEFHRFCHGEARFRFVPAPLPRATVNALLSLVVGAVGLVRIARWARLDPPPPVPVLLGVDLIVDTRLYSMLEDVTDEPSQVLGVFRNADDCKRQWDWWLPYPSCRFLDGFLSLGQALRAAAQTVAREAALWRRFGHLDPRHYFAVAKFPLIEVMYQALMEKYRFAYFLGRDDYNAEHMFRTWELRRRGGVSIGINHGAPYNPPLYPIYRYIDFDIYYAFGEDIYRKYYAHKWPDTVRIKPVGAFGMRRVEMEALAKPHPDDIIFFVKLMFDDPAILDDVCTVGRAFPDRTVYLKIKRLDVEKYFDQKIDGKMEIRDRFFAHKPDNVVFTEEHPYSLLCRASFAISTPSTVVFEAIQFGLKSFCFDNYPEDIPFQFREYPGLCYRRIDEIIDRMKAIDAGRWRYPRQSFAGLVDISGRNIFDVIRGDIGLPPMASDKIVRTPRKDRGPH
jgi:hypothetical protein